MQKLEPGKTRNVLKIGAVIVAACAVTKGICAENNDALLNLMLKKGMITQDEAEKVSAEALAQSTNAATLPAAKWKFSSGIKDLELFGDVRLRYEGRSVTDPGGGSIDLKRYRYALRFGLRGDVFDDFYYGFRLETASNARSPWVTFGTATGSSTGQYQGPFGKSNAGLNVGQIYLGWQAADWVNITAGKMPMPLYVTPMLWDSDFSPEGLAERFKYKVGPVEFFANFGQFIYQDVNPNQSALGYFNIQGWTNSAPPLLLAWQAGFEAQLTRAFSFKAAPAVYNYTGHGANAAIQGNNPAGDFAGVFVGQGTRVGVLTGSPYYNLGSGSDGFFANQTGINDLLIIDFPWEFNYKWDDLNVKLFGDFAQNLDGSARAQAAFDAQQNQILFPLGSGLITIPSPQKNDTKAWQVGLSLANKDSAGLVYGSTSRRHGWELRTYWQHIEQYALDPNLLDSDFFEGRGNLEGIYAAFAYGFSDNITGTLRYGYAKCINKNLGTGGSNQDIPQMNPIDQYDLVQLDMGFRF